MFGAFISCDDFRPALASDGEYIIGGNQRGFELFRVRPDQIIGTHVSAWADYQYRELISLRLAVFNRRHDYGDELPMIQFVFIRLDGSKFWSDLRVRWVAEHIACGVYSRIVEIDEYGTR